MNDPPDTQLWASVARATAEALARNALLPIATDIDYVEEAGVEFPVRLFPQIARKERLAGRVGDQQNPFLVPDPALRVLDLSESHVCLLNKFPVLPDHLLAVTRAFEDQQEPLNANDFKALWQCMNAVDALGFYNGGKMAGASQPHKHLQVVPLPLAPRGASVPIEPLLEWAAIHGDTGCSPRLPFPHHLARLPAECVDSVADAATVTLTLYRRMLSELGRDPDVSPVAPYNLLVTRQWLLMVPRSHEKFTTISLNALAFAGHFLVRNATEMTAIERHRPLAVLRHCSAP